MSDLRLVDAPVVRENHQTPEQMLGVFTPRLAAKVEITDTCWLWGGAKDGGGYGSAWHGGRADCAHRVMYREHVGPIPRGMQVDHMCRNRACIRPSHLQLATNLENSENRVANKNSATGVRGVMWYKRDRRYIVQVMSGGVSHYGGSFDSLDDAEQAAIALRMKLHTNNLADRGLVTR